MIGEQRVLKTELEFLVECIKEMRRLQQTHGFLAAQRFRYDMERYFRLPLDVRSTFVYDELVRLDSLQAGSLKARDDRVLRRLHEMVPGEYFRLENVLCTFRRHEIETRDGWFSYVFDVEGVHREQTMTYNDAWSKATEGELIFGRGS